MKTLWNFIVLVISWPFAFVWGLLNIIALSARWLMVYTRVVIMPKLKVRERTRALLTSTASAFTWAVELMKKAVPETKGWGIKAWSNMSCFTRHNLSACGLILANSGGIGFLGMGSEGYGGCYFLSVFCFFCAFLIAPLERSSREEVFQRDNVSF